MLVYVKEAHYIKSKEITPKMRKKYLTEILNIELKMTYPPSIQPLLINLREKNPMQEHNQFMSSYNSGSGGSP